MFRCSKIEPHNDILRFCITTDVSEKGRKFIAEMIFTSYAVKRNIETLLICDVGITIKRV